MAIGIYISIITLNLNGLIAPTKRHRLDEWIQKLYIYIYVSFIHTHTHAHTRTLTHTYIYKKPTSDLKTHIN